MQLIYRNIYCNYKFRRRNFKKNVAVLRTFLNTGCIRITGNVLAVIL
jgi:hypothetical protein